MIKFKQFRRLYEEALEQPDVDMYVAERGWQSWMNEYAGNPDDETAIIKDNKVNKVVEILYAVHDLHENAINKLVAMTGLTQFEFARRYGIPLRTVENWCSDTRKAPVYVNAMLAFIVFFEEGVI